jgi:hypothetical protein
MATYSWKILELTQEGGKVTKVKYRCEAKSDKHTVVTEGNWVFRVSYDYSDNLTEHQVSHWLEMDTQEGERHLIKDRLAEQLQALDNSENRDPPWKVETFKVKL